MKYVVILQLVGLFTNFGKINEFHNYFEPNSRRDLSCNFFKRRNLIQEWRLFGLET